MVATRFVISSRAQHPLSCIASYFLPRYSRWRSSRTSSQINAASFPPGASIDFPLHPAFFSSLVFTLQRWEFLYFRAKEWKIASSFVFFTPLPGNLRLRLQLASFKLPLSLLRRHLQGYCSLMAPAQLHSLARSFQTIFAVCCFFFFPARTFVPFLIPS